MHCGRNIYEDVLIAIGPKPVIFIISTNFKTTASISHIHLDVHVICVQTLK